jgi:hypothetical protein
VWAETVSAELKPSCPAFQLKVLAVVIGALKGMLGYAMIGARAGDFVSFARFRFTAPVDKRVENDTAGSSS